MVEWIAALAPGTQIRRQFVVLACVLCCALASADEPPRAMIPCRVTSIHDGDTITVDVLFPWDVSLVDQSVRMQGFDAWEITRTRQTVRVTATEIERGKAAKQALATLLESADGVYLSPADKRDPYGRLPAFVSVWFDGKLIEVAEYMANHGHVRGQ